MCEFISWVEKRDKLYFVTGKQLFETKKGQEFIKTISSDDYCGHGTIRDWYHIDAGDGIDRECADFSMTDNFPNKIVEAIKDGSMRGLGMSEQLLTPKTLAEYKKIRQSASDEYDRIRQSAWDEYKKIRQSASDEYDRIRQSASDEYERIEQSAWAEYEKMRQSAFWDLFAIPENRNPAWR